MYPIYYSHYLNRETSCGCMPGRPRQVASTVSSWVTWAFSTMSIAIHTLIMAPTLQPIQRLHKTMESRSHK